MSETPLPQMTHASPLLERGLSDAEAARRLRQYGPNQWRVHKPTSAFRIFLAQLASIVVWLLMGAAAVAFIAGEQIEAIAIGGVLVLNTLIGFVIEVRARRSMEALLRYESSQALVIRDGQRRTIAAHDVVPGDIVELDAGQGIPADIELLRTDDFLVDEAPLTGESVPVEKDAHAPSSASTALGDRRNMAYAGTTVQRGMALGVVSATGMQTELGHIGGLVAGIRETKTPLERRLDVLGRRLVLITLALGVIVFGVGIVGGEPLLPMLEMAIALAVAAVPEGLPTVATIALAIGLRRMARRHALVRRLHSVEALGSATVLCADKTGTLTAGQMTVERLSFADNEVSVFETSADAQMQRAAQIGWLAGKARIEHGPEGFIVTGDPTDAALQLMALATGLIPEAMTAEWMLSEEIPFTSARKYTGARYLDDKGAELLVVKGAPESVLALCDAALTRDGVLRIDDVTRRRIHERNEQLAAEAMRVIALAYNTGEALSSDVAHLTFVALAGIADPPAPNAAATITKLRDAGIATIMITGDHRKTAEAVARQLGLTDEQAIYARVTPEQKLDIVTTLQKRGEIVAFIGDGVNDAAALKKADVGVAMGMRGTDVAKETAAVVLQDDKLETIAAAVEEGRVIYDNIRKFIFYLFSCNLAEIIVILVATMLGMPALLMPLQILWLNLVTDTFPALALAIEPGDPDVMSRPPRARHASLMSTAMIRAMVFYALLISAVTLAASACAHHMGASEVQARTMVFSTLALAQLFHLGNARSTRHVLHWVRALANKHAIAAVVLVVVLQLGAVQYPGLQHLLGTTALSADQWIVVSGLALLPAFGGQLLRSRSVAA